MTRKPRILLIPNVAWWIIGEMGKRIMARFGDAYDFYFFPESLLERRSDLLNTLVANVDAIHCLNESSIELFRNHDPATLPPIATWIHHVTRWSDQHQLAVERSSALTVCTESWKRDLRERTCGKIPVTVVPHGVDLDFFQRKQTRQDRFGIGTNKFVVGFIGGKGSDFDGGRKGTDVLLEVIRRSSTQLPNVHVVLGGPGWDSEMAGLRKLGVSVSATGYLPKSDLPALYSAMDVYLLTSRVEGGPCTIFEAMACETAVVATRVGAVPALVVEGVNGFSAEVDDVEGLVRAVVEIGRKPGMSRDLGRRGRNAVEKLPWSTTLTPLGAFYQELIRSAPQTDKVAPQPAWMRDPETVLRVSSAADAVAHVTTRVRSGSLSPVKGVRTLFELLDRKSPSDILRGFAMWRGLTFKSAPSGASARN